MLNNIRKASNSLLIRILLAMVAFAFVGWGIKDVLQAKSNVDLVTFSKAKNISEADFLKAKAEEISIIQRQMGVSLTEEEINQLGIDNIVIKRLIDDSIMRYIVSHYGFDISDETVIKFVQDSPVFKNAKGEFDIEIFKSTFKNSYRSEEDYLLNMKEQMLKHTLVGIFLETFKTPELEVKSFIDYMAEVRSLDLVSINLKNQPKDLIIEEQTTETLSQFYENNKELFTLPEMRSFFLTKISAQFLQKKINLASEELLNFYNENKDEFNNKTFEQAKKEIIELLNKQKYEELAVEFTKNLEDMVAAGSTLNEIAEKFGLKSEDINDMTYEDIVNDETGIAIASDTIFELTEGEVSYPLELPDKSGIFIVELKSIKPSKIEEFTLVKNKVAKFYRDKYLEDFNLKVLTNIANEYKPSGIASKDLNANAISVNSRFSISRSELDSNDQLPQELLMSIFQIKKNSNSPVFRYGDKAYFAHVKSFKIDPIIARNIRKKAGDNILQAIQYGVIEELVNYFAAKNNMRKIRLHKKIES